jgi:hypothetical protein
MRSSHILSTLLAVAATAQAQSESFLVTSVRRTSSIEDVDIQPTATATASGPIQTGKACVQAAEIIYSSRVRYPSIEAEVGATQTTVRWTQMLILDSWRTHVSSQSRS